jgi:CheY-like chemotaxis protein
MTTPSILIVEDNPLDLDLALRAFRKRRLANHIDIARDGEEAIGFIARWEAGHQAPLIILLDLRLPKHSGIEVLDRIKSHPVYRMIPVIVLTTSDEDRDVSAAYALGASAYIVKPVDFEKFQEVVERVELYWCVCTLPHITRRTP